jgi:hypothetical protein
MHSLPLLFCFDVEPDERQIDLNARAPWRGFEATFDFFSQLRPRLKQTTGNPVHFNWFLRMDPQVERGYGSATWIVDNYRPLIAKLESRGDELGLHIHATRWNETARSWIADYGDKDWVNYCVESSFTAFEKGLNRGCRSVSFGDRWSSNETVALTEELGAAYFLSVEPGAVPGGSELGYEFTGDWPDYSITPSEPYKPDLNDYRRAHKGSSRNLWIVPLSAGKYEGEKTFRLWRLKRLAKSLGFERQRNSESTTLRLHMSPPIFQRVLDGLINIANVRYLAMVLRSEVCADVRKRAAVEENIDYLIRHPEVKRLRFVTPGEAIKSLT